MIKRCLIRIIIYNLFEKMAEKKQKNPVDTAANPEVINVKDVKEPKDSKEQKDKQFDEVMLEVRRVTRVTTWWRKLSFRAVIIVWDRKGKIGIWIAKSLDVAWAVRKATHEAYKNIVEVPVTGADTVPYAISHKYKSAVIKLLPATWGTWLKAWSSVRSVLELAWYNNILSKIVWTNNKLTNALATIGALSRFKLKK